MLKEFEGIDLAENRCRLFGCRPVGDTGPAVEAVSTVAEIQEGVKTAERVLVQGGGSKPALSTDTRAGNALTLKLSGLTGVVDYQADEYTFTARAGTPVADVEAMLAEQGQYLPFDPPFAARGATLGGTVAAGLSGSGRYRYGGVRDFLIGMRFVDGQGQEVRGGGAVVKNAAGFDFPKLFVGSLGRLGVLTELTFKVFPQPPAFATVYAEFDMLADLLSALHAVTGGAIDLHAVDFGPSEDGWTLWVRIGGLNATLEQRVEALQALVSAGANPPRRMNSLLGRNEDHIWQQARAMAWLPEDTGLMRVPLTPRRIAAVEEALCADEGVTRRYSVGGNLLWLGWRDSDETAGSPELNDLLLDLDLRGIQLMGRAQGHSHNDGDGPVLGKPLQNPFLRRIAASLDPAGKFGGY